MLKIKRALLVGVMSVGLVMAGSGVASASCPECSDGGSTGRSDTGKRSAPSGKQAAAPNKLGTAASPGKVDSTCRICN